MAVQLVCASHSPLMLTDIEESQDGEQERFFASLSSVASQVRKFSPDLVVVFGPDHFNGFFYELMPSFCVGLAGEATRDWSIKAGPARVPRQLALECVRHLHRDDIDTAVSFDMKLDHGITIPLIQLTGAVARYDVLPLFVNCSADPRPSFRRARQFGESVGRFLARQPDLDVTLIGSGGLSHDPPTPRLDRTSTSIAARLIEKTTPSLEELQAREARVVQSARDLVNGRGPCLPPSETWDRQFIQRLLDDDIDALDQITDQEIDRDAGFGGHEVRTWVAATAAARTMGNVRAKLDYYHIIPEWLTGMCIMSNEV